MNINIGAINGRRVATFKVTNDGMVLRTGYTSEGQPKSAISARESFRRWKVARKAWATRRIGKQLLLKL